MKRAVLFFLMASCSMAWGESYKMELVGQGRFSGSKMNNFGQVAVTGGATSEIAHLAVWTPEAGFQNILFPEGSYGSFLINDFNDVGQMTGRFQDQAGGPYKAYVGSVSAPFRKLDLLASTQQLDNQGFSINNSGIVVGQEDTPVPGLGFIYGDLVTWGPGGNTPSLGSISSNLQSGESYINDANYVVTGSRLWRVGVSGFKNLRGTYQNVNGSTITNSGRIYGGSFNQSFTLQSLEAWDINGTRLYSKLLSSFMTMGEAGNIATMVPVNGVLGGTQKGQIWNPLTGTITAVDSYLDPVLISQGWSVSQVKQVNDQGQMLVGMTKDGQTYTARLSPVPEPASLIALSLGIMGVMRRRKQTA